MDERVSDDYRAHGPALFAGCRRLLGDDATAAAATPRVFSRMRGRMGDAALLDKVTRETCAEMRRLLLVPEGDEPTAEEIAAARERFERDVYERTLPLVLRDERPPRILRWIFFYAPILVLSAFLGMIYERCA